MTRQPFPSRKFAQWPAEDQALWLAAFHRDHVLGDGGPAAHWSSSTIARCESCYGVWLHWLAANGWLDVSAAPCARVTKDRLDAFRVAYSIGRAPFTVAGTISAIAMLLRACTPPDGVAWLTPKAFRMMNIAKPVRAKLPRMASLQDLLSLSDQLMQEGWQQLDRGQPSGAVRFRDGLLIAFLVYRPLRVRNLSYLRIGDTIHFGDHSISIAIDAAATKKGVSIGTVLPDRLVTPLQNYRERVRPVLLARQDGDPGWLWLGRRGNRLTEEQIATRVRKMCEAHLDKSMTPHLFRDCAVTAIAEQAPGEIGIAKDVLAHATVAASEKFYNQATAFAAAKAYGDIINSLRGDEE